MRGDEEGGSFDEGLKKGMEIPCPRCREPMHMTATRCPHCHADFTPDEVRANIAGKKTDARGCLIIAAAAIGLAGLAAVSFSSGGDDDAVSVASASPSAGEIYAWEEAAKQVVRERLRDPESAEFRDLVVHPGDAGTATIICGKVNSRNGFGGMTGPQHFIAGGTVMLEEEFSASQWQIAWSRFCS